MSDKNPVTTGSGGLDLSDCDIPVKRIRVARSGFNTGMNGKIPDEVEVNVPDLDRIDSLVGSPLGTNSFNIGNTDTGEYRKKVEEKMWQAVREIGQASKMKNLDASNEGDFMDVLYKAVHRLEKQAGAPENANVYVNPETNKQVRRWMDRDNRLDMYNDTEELTHNSVRVAGYPLTFIEAEGLETGELVLAESDIRATPHSCPFTYVTNLPIGVEVEIKINGRDNDIVVHD